MNEIFVVDIYLLHSDVSLYDNRFTIIYFCLSQMTRFNLYIHYGFVCILSFIHSIMNTGSESRGGGLGELPEHLLIFFFYIDQLLTLISYCVNLIRLEPIAKIGHNSLFGNGILYRDKWDINLNSKI